MVGGSTDPAPPIVEVEQNLRKAAAKLGADAVVVVYDRVQPVAAYVVEPWWGQSIESISGRRLIAERWLIPFQMIPVIPALIKDVLFK